MVGVEYGTRVVRVEDVSTPGNNLTLEDARVIDYPRLEDNTPDKLPMSQKLFSTVQGMESGSIDPSKAPLSWLEAYNQERRTDPEVGDSFLGPSQSPPLEEDFPISSPPRRVSPCTSPDNTPRDPTNPAPVIILKRPINNPKMNLESDAFQPWNLNEPVPLVFPFFFGECRLVP